MVNLVEARVRDLNQVGPVLDEAVAVGANKVLAVTFDVADSGSLENQARAAAMADARGRAEQLARLAGVELVSEGGTVVPIPRVEVRALAAVSYSTPIEGWELCITARVQVTYETMTASGRG